MQSFQQIQKYMKKRTSVFKCHKKLRMDVSVEKYV